MREMEKVVDLGPVKDENKCSKSLKSIFVKVL